MNLKLIASILLILFAFSSCRLLKIRKYRKDKYFEYPGLNAYAGVWKYINDQDTFWIDLRVERQFFPEDITYMAGGSADRLVGEYYTSKHGSSTNKTPPSFPMSYGLSIGAFDNRKKKKGLITMYIWDFVKEKGGRVFLEPLSLPICKASWSIMNHERTLINGQTFDWSWSMPNDVVLTKVDCSSWSELRK